MKLAIMQPYFFPYLGYFSLIASVDKLILLDDVNYIKGGWINRNRILVNQTIQWLTIRLEQASPNKLIQNIDRVNDTFHNRKILKTIEMAYHKRPYFSSVYSLIENLITSNINNLSLFLYKTLININQYLGIDTEIIPSSSIYPKNELKGQERILDICLREKADDYINLPGGKDLYDQSKFHSSGINLYFIKPCLSPYYQGCEQFIPALSIIDVLMWNSPEKVLSMVHNYELEKP